MKFRLKPTVIFAVVHFAIIFSVCSIGFYNSISAATGGPGEHTALAVEKFMKIFGPILLPTSWLFSELGWKDPSIGTAIFIASLSSIIYGVLFSFALGLAKRNTAKAP